MPAKAKENDAGGVQINLIGERYSLSQQSKQGKN